MREPNPFSAIQEPPKPAAAPRKQPVQIRQAVRGKVEQLSGACKRFVPGALEQAFFFGGLGAVVWGCGMIYRPLGPIVGGLVSVGLSVLISMERNEPGS